jgi:hypothetical protein
VRVTTFANPPLLDTVMVEDGEVPAMAGDGDDAERLKPGKLTVVDPELYPVAAAVTVAVPSVLEVIVTVHEPPAPVVQLELDRVPRFVDNEMS